MQAQIVRDRQGGQLQKLDVKKLPPGHAIFRQERGKSLIIAGGYPYTLGGDPLPVDVGKLSELGYPTHEAVIKLLAARQRKETAQPKNCIKCSASIPYSSKFCLECGSQQIWVPGSDDPEGQAIARLVDASDPLGSLMAIQRADEPGPPRETPDDIFKRLNAQEEQLVRKDLPSSSLGELGPEGITYADSEFGKVEMSRVKKKK